MDRIVTFLIHILGGKTEDEVYRMVKDAYYNGEAQMIGKVYRWGRGLSGKSPKIWRRIMWSYIETLRNGF